MHELEEALDHVDEPLEEYPEVQGIEEATNQPFLISECIIDSFLYDVQNGVELVSNSVFL